MKKIKQFFLGRPLTFDFNERSICVSRPLALAPSPSLYFLTPLLHLYLLALAPIQIYHPRASIFIHQPWLIWTGNTTDNCKSSQTNRLNEKLICTSARKLCVDKFNVCSFFIVYLNLICYAILSWWSFTPLH